MRGRRTPIAVLAAVMLFVGIFAARNIQSSIGADTGGTEQPVQFSPTSTGGCTPSGLLPSDVRNEVAFQAELWRFSLRTYPSCTVQHGRLARAAQMLARIPRSSGRFGARPFALSDGIGETAWSSLGPVGIDKYWGITSGRVNALAVDPKNPRTVYAGADNGGVWKSNDGGAHWSALTSKAGSPNIGALAIAPSNPQTIYAGTGSGVYSFYGNGLMRSLDGGASWSQVAASTFQNVDVFHKIIVDPHNAQTIWAATSNGLYRSRDDGSSWSLITSGKTGALPSLEASDVALDPVNSSIVYAALGSTWGWNNLGGVYKSTDGGVSWTLLVAAPNGNTSTPGGTSHAGRIEISVADPSTGEHVVYARVENPADTTIYGFYRSLDGGATWSQMATPNPGQGTYWYYDGILIDSGDPTGKTVWANGMDVFKTTDGGASWRQMSNRTNVSGTDVHVDQHALAVGGRTMYVGNDGGVYTTSNGGQTWSSRNDTLDITEFYGGSVDGTASPTTMGGSQDNGYEKTGGNPSSRRWYLWTGGDGTGSAIDYTKPQLYYGDYIYGRLLKSTDAGATWHDITYDWNDTGNPRFGIPRAELNSACWYAPFPMDPKDPTHFIFGTREVWESHQSPVASVDTKWTPRSGDLTGGSGCILSLAMAPSAPSTTYYAGTTNGRVWITRNDGGSWMNISAGLPGAGVTSIAVDQRNPSIAYVTEGSCPIGGCGFRTADAGSTWQKVTGNLPSYTANVVVIDPVDPSHLYLGTDQSVFETTDLGRTWTVLDSNLPIVPIDGLVLNHGGTSLTAATYGRGMFRLYRSWLNLGAVQGFPGRQVRVTGFGYQSKESVDLYFGGILQKTAVADFNGVVRTTFSVPALVGNTYPVQLQGVASGRVAVKSFTIK